MPTLSYNGHVLPDTTNIENGIIPPPPRRAMGPARNCRQLNCPVPIAHRGGGSAEVALEAAFSYNIHGRKTCHNEKRKSFDFSILVRLSYKPTCPGGHNEDRKWHYAAPPPDGQWARPGTVDGSIGRFLLPVGGGALLR